MFVFDRAWAQVLEMYAGHKWRLDGSNVLSSELWDWGNNLQHGEPSILGLAVKANLIIAF